MKRKSEFQLYLQKLSDSLQEISAVSPDLVGNRCQGFLVEIDNQIEVIRESELLVPVVGGFSAGKSTAINTLLNREILPTAVTAETAIPAEIRYSNDERIIAVTVDDKEEIYPLHQLGELSKNAELYQVVRLYIDSPYLLEIEPFVLVDMPGFDSSYDHHNKAILRYLSRGAFYLFCVSAKDGTLHREDIRRIDDVINMGRDFRVILTKKDLCAPSELGDIEQMVQEQLDESYGFVYPVVCIDHENTNAIIELVNQSNPNRLFNNIHIHAVKDIYYSLNNTINTAISGLKSSKEENELALAKHEQTLQSVREEYEAAISSIGERDLADSQRKIISKVESQLNASVDELATQARVSEDALVRTVGDIVRSCLIIELQKATSKVSSQTVKRFSDVMELNLNINLSMGEDWAQNLINSLQSSVMDVLVSGVDPRKNNFKSTTVPQSGISSLLTGLAIAIPHPVLKVVLAILPGIIGSLFNQASESREKAQIADAIRTQVIPSVLRQIEPEVSEALRNAAHEMTKIVAEKFEEKITDQKKILELAQADADKERGEISCALSVLEKARKEIDDQTTSILLKEI